MAIRLERIRALGETSKDDSVMLNNTELSTSRLARHSSDQQHPNTSNEIALKQSNLSKARGSHDSSSPDSLHPKDSLLSAEQPHYREVSRIAPTSSSSEGCQRPCDEMPSSCSYNLRPPDPRNTNSSKASSDFSSNCRHDCTDIEDSQTPDSKDKSATPQDAKKLVLQGLLSASPSDRRHPKTGDEFQLEQWHDHLDMPGLRSNSLSNNRHPKDLNPLLSSGRARDCFRTLYLLNSECSKASDGRSPGRDHTWHPLAHSIARLSSLRHTNLISPLAPASADAIARSCDHEGPILTNPLLISPVKSRIIDNPHWREIHASRLHIREASQNSRAPSSPRIAQRVLNQLHARTGDNAPFRRLRDFTDPRALQFSGMEDNLLVSPIFNSDDPLRVLLALTSSNTVVHSCGYHGVEDNLKFFLRLKASTSARRLVMNWPPDSLREIATVNCTPVSTGTVDNREATNIQPKCFGNSTPADKDTLVQIIASASAAELPYDGNTVTCHHVRSACVYPASIQRQTTEATRPSHEASMGLPHNFKYTPPPRAVRLSDNQLRLANASPERNGTMECWQWRAEDKLLVSQPHPLSFNDIGPLQAQAHDTAHRPDCHPTPEDRQRSANPGFTFNCQHERTDIGCSPTCNIAQLPCPRLPGSLEFRNAYIDQGSHIRRQFNPREQLLLPLLTAIFSSRPPAIPRSDLTNVPAGLPRARSITMPSYAHDTLISIVRRSKADQEHELRPQRSPNGDSLHGQRLKAGDEWPASGSHEVANFSSP